MEWFMKEKFEEIREMAENVVNAINYKSGAVDINAVIEAVKNKKRAKILIGEVNFDDILGGNFATCGAAMAVKETNAGSDCVSRDVRILLNSNSSPERMRFSTVHELGHLMAENYTVTDDVGRFSVSLHINPDIISIDKKKSEDDESYETEQVANIFALLVLMPKVAFSTAKNILESERSIADYFGVEVEAVRSRMQLIMDYGE